MNKAVLDTDTLSAIMRRESAAISNAQAYLSSHSQLSVSIVTRYEILRGLEQRMLHRKWLRLMRCVSQWKCFRSPTKSSCVLPKSTVDCIGRANSSATPTF